jgi:hypothetical protein
MTKINCETTSGIFIHEGMKVIKEKRGGERWGLRIHHELFCLKVSAFSLWSLGKMYSSQS